MKKGKSINAVTIKEIKGSCIPTIPAGTKFHISHKGESYSSCSGLGITSIWNDEWVFLQENKIKE